MAAPERQPAWPLIVMVSDHPPSANELRRLHPLVRYRRCKPFKDQVAWQCRALHLPAPLPRARVVATLNYTRRQFRDYDGAVASLKPVLDGLVVGGVLVDDGPAHLELEVRQELSKERAVRLEIWPASQGPDAPAMGDARRDGVAALIREDNTRTGDHAARCVIGGRTTRPK